MAKLFFSYSHKDETLRDELQTHLEMLKRSGAIETWHDRMIPVGDELDGAIDQKMEEADVILLLVSSDFLASNYCYDIEVKRAMERHAEESARVIPVILRPCDWKHDTPFKKLLVAPTDGRPITKWPDRDEAYLNVVTQIRSALSAAPKTTTRCPSTSVPQTVVKDLRSSNLRVTKTFTEADKDRFLDEGFEYMAKFFEGSLEELQKRNENIQTTFKRLDAESFSAIIYKDGNTISSCAVTLGGSRMFGHGITYSNEIKNRRNSFNEILDVETSDQSLHLKSTGMLSMLPRSEKHQLLTNEGAAELYWSKLIEPLQRQT